MIYLFIVRCHPSVAENSKQHALSSWRFLVNPWQSLSLRPCPHKFISFVRLTSSFPLSSAGKVPTFFWV
jgi:hypothetical protein